MPLWGNAPNAESKPKHLSTEDARNTYATDKGWTFKNGKGLEEVLVAIRNLEGANTTTGIGAPNITEIYFNSRTANTDDVIVNVVFNEVVQVASANATHPYIVLTGDYSNADPWPDGGAAGDGQAALTSGNNTNILSFTYTPNDGAVDTVTLTGVANTITLGSTTIQDAAGTDAGIKTDAAGADGTANLQITTTGVDNASLDE